jgi:hypothetical protein
MGYFYKSYGDDYSTYSDFFNNKNDLNDDSRGAYNIHRKVKIIDSPIDLLNNSVIYNNIDDIKRKLQDKKLSINLSDAERIMKNAILYYNKNIFDLLITDKRFKKTDTINFMIIFICERSVFLNKKIINKVLNLKKDLSFNKNQAIKTAIKCNNTKLIIELIKNKSVNPSIKNNIILKRYIRNKNLVSLLIKDYRVLINLDDELKEKLISKKLIPTYKPKLKNYGILFTI